jgi:hypothetical protein
MIIISERKGKLGNRLFLGAYGLALAKATGQRVINLSMNEYASDFPGATLDHGFIHLPMILLKFVRFLIKLLRWPARKHPMFTRIDFYNSAAFSPGNPDFLASLMSRRVTFIEGWFNPAEITFQPTDPIRACFRPTRDLMEATRIHIERARAGADLLIGVHIRHGDYKRYLCGAYYFPLEVYRRVMERMLSFFPQQRVAFLVCSNETQQAGAFAPLQVTLGPGTPIGDLYGLADCDYIIGAPSTYSLWAAFYGLKPIFHMKTAEAPADLTEFMIPDGHFECIQLPYANFEHYRIVG